jgi:esterase/lipase
MEKDILLLHGALGSSRQMDCLLPYLQNRSVYCPDLPGHGTHAGQAFTIESLSLWLKNYLEENNLSQLRVFGYSMGGYLALKHESEYPGTFFGVTTLGTKFDWSEKSAEMEASRLDSRFFLEKAPEFADLLMERHGVNWKTVLLETAEMMRILGKQSELDLNQFYKIQCHVNLILGEFDKMVKPEETITVANLILHSKYSLLSGAKHPFESLSQENLRLLTTFILG